MEVKIEKMTEVFRETETKEAVTLYNPEALDHTLSHRMKSIERTDEYTRIDFIYRSSELYVNGGWIQMDGNAYISPVGSSMKYRSSSERISHDKSTEDLFGVAEKDKNVIGVGVPQPPPGTKVAF